MKRIVQFTAAACAALAVFSAHAARAEIVASYEFSGGSLLSSDTSADSTASAMSVVNAASVTGNVTFTGAQVTTTSGTSYLQFTVTPIPSVSLSYLTISFDFIGAGGLSTTNFFTIAVKAGATPLGSVLVQSNGAGSTSFGIGITSSLPLVFTLDITDSGFTQSSRTVSLDNIKVDATAAVVPLPDSLGLLLSGIPCLMAGVWLWRQKLKLATQT